eukprot:1159733-Pelagomonas_calceolata.AAC.11
MEHISCGERPPGDVCNGRKGYIAVPASVPAYVGKKEKKNGVGSETFPTRCITSIKGKKSPRFKNRITPHQSEKDEKSVWKTPHHPRTKNQTHPPTPPKQRAQVPNPPKSEEQR